MRYSINLLGKKESSLADRAVYFSLNYLRYIIVITQLVVIAVFFYRFQIDQSIIDLKESVDQKKEIIQVVYPLLNEAEVVDAKTKNVKNIIQDQEISRYMLEYILSAFPQDIYLTDIEVKSNSVKMVGTALDPQQLQSYYLMLKREKRFAIIDLKNINKGESGFVFSLELKNFVIK
ncbi:hypothetical protein COT62_01475 [Candidatus Roizmanbacteria bacterium CG09_land_8_20_14_0_10_41_9]|uniref:Uncharacterized protein n=1 Tax=Candidatus Roizmanbacteria bacterium CG09_land_8_20_14_0_10_41_9 TaxID=1974850 RepID=A0A2H0WTA6_9BACT|nr:MAG: hypothetical protein COT62_01475 [Candidatus Roizmanbacteria bacterium CG09_land_8_20_14_0_10_41_9]